MLLLGLFIGITITLMLSPEGYCVICAEKIRRSIEEDQE